MAGIQISGLTSGLDASAIVGQLMAVERQAKTPILFGQAKANALSDALTNLNGLFKKLGDAAGGFSPASVLDKSNFEAVTAKSSDEAIATVTPGAKPSSADLSFTVKSVAQASSVVSKNAFTLTEGLGNGQALNLSIATGGQQPTSIQVNPGATLSEVADAINKSGAGVHANLLKVNDTQYALQVTSDKTGAASTVSLTGTYTDSTGSTVDVFGGTSETVAAKDTEIDLGGGVTITSSDRTIKDLVPGLDVTVKKVSTDPVTITSKPDNDAIAAKADEFVKAINAVLGDISSKSKPAPNAAPATDADMSRLSSAGVFLGNSTVRDVEQRIQNVLVGSATNLPSDIGISIDKTGQATFDKDVFLKALNEDPDKVKAVMTETARQVGQVTKDATDVEKGSLTAAIKGQGDIVKDYTDRLQRFEDRMDATEARYKAKFAALDSMLSKMKSQGDWLAGQLNSLPGASK